MVEYTPDPGFGGQDTFTYTVDDTAGGSNSATVTVTVTPITGPTPSPPPSGYAPVPLWVTNGTVYTMARAGGTLYIGGDFSRVGPPTGPAAQIEASNGEIPSGVNNFPAIMKVVGNNVATGVVNVIIPDRAGGYYIGGDFTSVGDLPRSNLARINSDGAVHTFAADTNGPVEALYLSGSTLYVGGNFTAIGTSIKYYFAAIDTITGLTVPGWESAADGEVLSIASNGAYLLVGGVFSNINGSIGDSPRNSIAAFNIANGFLIEDWNPDITSASGTARVCAIVTDGKNVYAGGYFDTAGDASIQNLAQINIETGSVNTSFNPAPDNTVNAIVLDGTDIYIGGEFTVIDGQTRNYIARLTSNVANPVTDWNPGANGPVKAMTVYGTTIYTGGAFTEIGGQERNFLAALDTISFTDYVLPWNPAPAGEVNTLQTDGITVYAGGNFAMIGGLVRNNLAALDIETGLLTEWAPGADGVVKKIELDAATSTVYIGGSFQFINGIERNCLASVDTAGLLTTWAPALTEGNSIEDIGIDEDNIYVCGDFTGVDGLTTGAIAVFDKATGQVDTSWELIPNAGPVYKLSLAGSSLYLSGLFTQIGGLDRQYLAEVDIRTDHLTTFNPHPNDYARDIAIVYYTVYAGGDFTSLYDDNVYRYRMASFDLSTGNMKSFDPTFINGPVNSLDIDEDIIYAGGLFEYPGASSKVNFFAHNRLTGVLIENYIPNPNGEVHNLLIDGEKIYVGGSFTEIGGKTRSGIAVIDKATGSAY